VVALLYRQSQIEKTYVFVGTMMDREDQPEPKPQKSPLKELKNRLIVGFFYYFFDEYVIFWGK
jgi:hypothetical protein